MASNQEAEERLRSALADRYTIEREIGSGGMAVVYLAQDLRHDRKVAVKVLKPELAAVVGTERFLAEIRTTANLSHPHILPLHDSGEAGGFLFYVMPYVEGDSLRQRLDRDGQLSVEEAVRISGHVADALESAHRHGVIHRDLKPANILFQEGEPVVADFGIALAVTAAGEGRLTETGLSLGTPYYMSPEQATGDQTPTAASDVYSLGCVLYEMLTGDPPHTGSTAQAILGKILLGEVTPPTKLRRTTPANVESAVLKALERLPADRFASTGAFAAALKDKAFRHGVEGGAPGVGAWKRVAVLLTFIAVLATLFALWGWLRSPQGTLAPPMPVARAYLQVSDGEKVVPWTPGCLSAISPDGARIVYAGFSEGGTQLWLRSLDERRATPIPGTVGARAPFFSPDGQRVAFQDGRSGSLRTVSISGSSPTMLVEQTRVIAGDWGPDGMVYFGLIGGGIGRVAASGGEVEVLTSPDTLRGELSHTTVDVLPNGKGALITIWHGQFSDAEIAILEFSTGAIRVLDRGMHPRYAQSGHVVYLREDLLLLAAPFDQINLELVGSANVLTEEVGRSISVGVGEYSISETGTLLKVEHQEGQRELAWVDRDGREGVIDPEWKGSFFFPALSPDGTRLAISTAVGGGGRHIWIKDLPYGQPTQLTFEGSSNQPPVWSLDGQRLIYLSSRNREYGFWVKQADGTSAATLVLPVETYAQSMSWSKDGTWLVYQLRRPTGGGQGYDIFGYQPDLGGSPIPLLVTDFDEKNPALSPDGQWLAYDSNRSGQYEVYVRPFPIVSGDVRFRVSNEGGVQPSWAHNGHELFYVNDDDELVAVEFETGQTFRILTENPLFSVEGYYFWPDFNHSFAVDVNDDRFLMLKSEESWELSLTFNFFEELKQRVGNEND